MYTYELKYSNWVNGSGWSYTDDLYEEGEAQTIEELWDEDEFRDWVADGDSPREGEDTQWTYTVYKDGDEIYSYSVWASEAKEEETS